MQVTSFLSNVRDAAKIKGPLYEQMASFRRWVGVKKSLASWIAERKEDINKIYNAMTMIDGNENLNKRALWF